MDGEGKVETPHRDAKGKLEYTTVRYSCRRVTDVVSHYRSKRRMKTGDDHIWPTLKNSWIEASPLIIDIFNKNHKSSDSGKL